MKLQKLLYYQQGFHLACLNTPLFDKDIEAWQYGPVVPTVYNQYQQYGSSAIHPYPEVITLEPNEELLFNEVCRVYGQYSAIGLMNLTHNEAPWMNTHTGKGQIISRELMTDFFRSRIQQ